jgi:hypothetical protein
VVDSPADLEPREFARPQPFIERLAARVEGRHPDWIVDNAFLVSLLWLVVWLALFIPATVWSWHILIRIGLVVVAGLPTVIASAICLVKTPESHLKREQSVLGTFLGRFIAYIVGFTVWTLSVIASVVVATYFQNADDGSVQVTVALGTQLLIASLPLAGALVLFVFTARCATFLWRLRGFAPRPKHTRMPRSFLSESPRTHRLLVGLANPLLLFFGGTFVSVIVAVGAWVDIGNRIFASF